MEMENGKWKRVRVEGSGQFSPASKPKTEGIRNITASISGDRKQCYPYSPRIRDPRQTKHQ
jgi:hypothetical protein